MDPLLNLDWITLVEASDILCLLAESGAFKATAQVQAQPDDLAPATHAKAQLVMEDQTCNLEFEISGSAGTVSIRGGIDGHVQAKQVRDIVEKLPGAREVSVKGLALVERM